MSPHHTIFHNLSTTASSLTQAAPSPQIDHQTLLTNLSTLSSSINLTQFDTEYSTLSNNLQDTYDPCAHFGPYGIALSIIYFITFCAIVRHCLRNKRPTLERTFICFLLINNVVRITYFLGWGIQNHDQCPTMIIDKTNRTWLSYFSNIPAHFYITAFSILVYKFSFVFHRIINISSSHRVLSSVVAYTLIIANVISYFVAIASMVQFSWFLEDKYSWVQTVSLNTLIVLSSTLAVLLFLYGNALFFTIQSYLKQVRQQWNQTEGIVAVQCDVANDLRDAQAQLLNTRNPQLHHRQHNQYTSPQHPMHQQQYNNGEHVNVNDPHSSHEANPDSSTDLSNPHSSQQYVTPVSDQLSASSLQHSSQTSNGTGKSHNNTTSSGMQSNQYSTGHNQHPHQHHHNHHPPPNMRANPAVQSGIAQQYNTMRSQQQQHLQLQHQQNRPNQGYSPHGGNTRGAQTMNFGQPNASPRHQQSSTNQFASMFSKPSPYSQQGSQGNLGSTGGSSNNGFQQSYQHSNNAFTQFNGSNQKGSNLGSDLTGDLSFSTSHQGSQNNLQQAFVQNHNLGGGSNSTDRGIPGHSRDNLTYLVDSSSTRSGPRGSTQQQSQQQSQQQQHRQHGVMDSRRLYNNTQNNNNYQSRPLLSSQANPGMDFGMNYGTSDQSLGLSDHNDELMDSQTLDVPRDPANYSNFDTELSGLVHLPGHSYYNDKGLLCNPTSPSALLSGQTPNESLLHRQHISPDGRAQRKFSLLDNYMFKPFVISIGSSLCFVIRVALLIAMSSFDVPQRPEIILLYSCCSEIIPMHLMWFVFDDPSLDNKESTTNYQLPAFTGFDDDFNDFTETPTYPTDFDANFGYPPRQDYSQYDSQGGPDGIDTYGSDSPLQKAMNGFGNHDDHGADPYFPLSGSKAAISVSTTGESTGLPHIGGEETYSIQASGSNLLSVPNTSR